MIGHTGAVSIARRHPARFRIALGGRMIELSKMIQRLYLAITSLTFGLFVVLAPNVAWALCTDPPGPGVNWQRCSFDGSDLGAVDLSGARLRDVSFFRADLSGSNLTKSDSSGAKYINAKMHSTVLDGAKLYDADLTKADLTGASLVGADLRLARFYRATLRGADLTKARLRGTDLARADLSGATWTDGQRVCAEGSIGRCN